VVGAKDAWDQAAKKSKITLPKDISFFDVTEKASHLLLAQASTSDSETVATKTRALSQKMTSL